MNIFTRFTICVLVTHLSGVKRAVADEISLEQRLKQIYAQRSEGITDPYRLEKECLNLLDENGSSEDKGKIYFQIAVIYSQNGMTEPDKVIKYSKKALDQVLEIPARVQMHLAWMGGLLGKYDLWKVDEIKKGRIPENQIVEGRRKTARVCLRGLKLLSTQDIPTERQPVPAVNKFEIGGPKDSPVYQEDLRKAFEKHEEEMRARRKAVLQNKLLFYRTTLIEKLALLYSLPPPADDELIALANEILEDQRFAAELVDEITQER